MFSYLFLDSSKLSGILVEINTPIKMFFFLAENNPEHLFNPAGHTRWAGFLHQELAKPSGLYYVLRQTKSVHKEEVSGIKLVFSTFTK